MASLLSENYLSCTNEGVDDDDVLKHNSFLLMSLLDETTQGDHDQLHYNDEELHNMIRSLEAEINTNRMEEQEHDLMLMDDVEFMDGQDYCLEYWISDLDHAIPWDINDDPMEQASSSSPTDELNLCMDYFCGNDDQTLELFYVPSDHHLY